MQRSNAAIILEFRLLILTDIVSISTMIRMAQIRPLALLVASFMVCACTSIPSGQEAPTYTYSGTEHPTEAHLFYYLPRGANQVGKLCARLAANNVQSVVRDSFCVEPRPLVTNSKELLEVLGLPFTGPGGKDAQLVLGNGNPAWAVIGHSASLSRRLVNPVNPRVIVHTPQGSHLESTPGFVVVAFTRGEGFAEIITHDPVRDDIDFFLFQFDYPCQDPPNCTNEERFSVQYESGWSDYTVYGQEDLENTPLDCLQCHQSGLRTSQSNRKSLLMFQLNSMWMHWMYDNRHFYDWTDNPNGPGPFHEMMEQYVRAHETPEEPLGETFGGVPDGAIYGSRPKSLENLIEGNGFGNGFDDDTYALDGASIGLLQDHRAIGIFFGYEADERYALNLNGLMITPPSPEQEPFDHNKLLALIDEYSAYRTGKTAEFPDMTNLFDKANLHGVGVRVQPNLSGPEILVQACSQCHHDGLNPKITRARFDVGDIASLSVNELQLAQERVNLPENHLKAMPPFRFRTLDSAERRELTGWLEAIIAGRSLSDDGTPPSPHVAEFDLLPLRVGPSMITMRAKPGVDPRGLVEYLFEETSGSIGGTSSAWQVSPRYLDTGLVVGETYNYRVKMRDSAGNEGAFSDEAGLTVEATVKGCDVAGPGYHPTTEKDSDCDTVPDKEEGEGDTDEDGIPDYLDPDDDGDGFSTATEKEDGETYGMDNDGDGKPVWLDTDSDGDGFSDEEEGGGDTDDDGIPGYLDPNEPCGNSVCDAGSEDCEFCPVDCPCTEGTICTKGECVLGAPVCDDGFCNMEFEDCGNCPGDCPCATGSSCIRNQCVDASQGPQCGDEQCTPGTEDCNSCPADCPCPGQTTCNDAGMCVAS